MGWSSAGHSLTHVDILPACSNPHKQLKLQCLPGMQVESTSQAVNEHCGPSLVNLEILALNSRPLEHMDGL